MEPRVPSVYDCIAAEAVGRYLTTDTVPVESIFQNLRSPTGHPAAHTDEWQDGVGREGPRCPHPWSYMSEHSCPPYRLDRHSSGHYDTHWVLVYNNFVTGQSVAEARLSLDVPTIVSLYLFHNSGALFFHQLVHGPSHNCAVFNNPNA